MGKLLTVRQVMKLFGISANLIYRLVKDARIPHFRVSNALRFDGEELKKFFRRKAE